MRILAYILCFVVSLSSAFAKTEPLWGKTEEGMSIKEVLALYPSATKSELHPNTTDYLRSKNHLVIKRHQLPIDIHSYYRVRFWFTENGLVKVGLVSLSGSEKQRDELIRLLTLKYGKPISTDNYGDLIRREWYQGGLDVRLEYTNRAGNDSEIGLYYFRKTDRSLESEL